jgi:hypothetical protein
VQGHRYSMSRIVVSVVALTGLAFARPGNGAEPPPATPATPESAATENVRTLEPRAEYSETKKTEFLVQSSQSSLNKAGLTLSSNSFRGVLDYYVYQNVALSGGYITMFSPEDGSSLLSGFDIGGKWYPLSPAAEMEYRADGISMQSWSPWTTYLLLSYRQRTLNLRSTQVGYSGYGIGLGVNVYLPIVDFLPFSNRLFLNFEVSQDSLKSVVKTNLRLRSFTLGLGSVF